MKHRGLDFLVQRLAVREGEGLLRVERTPLPHGVVDFSSNDYLGLAHERVNVHAEAGAGASRMVSGERDGHGRVEHECATWLGLPAALLFASGYAANLGTIAAVVEPGDLVVSDVANHASIIDGARLCRADVSVTEHNDLNAVEDALKKGVGKRRWVVCESYFSMDADGPDLATLRALVDRYDARLIVDESHAFGIMGPSGAGRLEETATVADIVITGLGKAIGAQGGIAAGAPELRTYLWNHARSFVFSTGISPVLLAATTTQLGRARSADKERATLTENTMLLRSLLRSLGLSPLGHGPIIPCVVGTASRAMSIERDLLPRGFFVSAIRPPTVPPDASRLRISASARHTKSEIENFARALGEVL